MTKTQEYQWLSGYLGMSPKAYVERGLSLKRSVEELPTQVGGGGLARGGSVTSPRPLPSEKIKKTFDDYRLPMTNTVDIDDNTVDSSQKLTAHDDLRRGCCGVDGTHRTGCLEIKKPVPKPAVSSKLADDDKAFAEHPTTVDDSTVTSGTTTTTCTLASPGDAANRGIAMITDNGATATHKNHASRA